MDAGINMKPIARKLLRALMQFRRAEWHQRSIAGYKPSEIKVLFCIEKDISHSIPGMVKVSDISKRLHVTSPTVTQLIKGLEANGLIERNIDPEDRRSVGIKLTEKGEMVTQQAAAAFEESVNGLIEYLGEEQSNQLAELLMKAFRYYEEKAISEQHAYWHGDEEA
jgi:DNA-binding MarR family transcriptional regulator